jgi:hypothetical protein
MDKSTLLLTACLAILATGCDQIGAQASKAVEQRVQKETGDLMEKAMGSVDKTLGSVGSQLTKNGNKPRVVAHESLLAAGISPTSLTMRETPERVAAIYCTFEKPFNSTLEVRFLDRTGAEIGRAQLPTLAKAGAGQFIEFPIDSRTNLKDIFTINIRRS